MHPQQTLTSFRRINLQFAGVTEPSLDLWVARKVDLPGIDFAGCGNNLALQQRAKVTPQQSLRLSSRGLAIFLVDVVLVAKCRPTVTRACSAYYVRTRRQRRNAILFVCSAFAVHRE